MGGKGVFVSVPTLLLLYSTKNRIPPVFSSCSGSETFNIFSLAELLPPRSPPTFSQHPSFFLFMLHLPSIYYIGTKISTP